MDCVGETLAEERRKRGRTLSDVEGATRIRARLLEALENGRYDELPPPAYVKGYIQSYASYLGISPQPLVERYAGETRFECEPQPLQMPQQVVPRRDQAHGAPVRSLFYVAAGLLAVALVAWGGARLLSGSQEPRPIPGSGTARDDQAQPATKPAAPRAYTKPAKSAGAVPGPQYLLQVKVAQGQASWLRVTVDGKRTFEGMMQGGQQQQWKVSQGASIRMGRTSAVEVRKDGAIVPLQKGAIVSNVEVPIGE